MNSKIILTLASLLICSTVICQIPSTKQDILSLGWPVHFSKTNFPSFNGDNFVILGYGTDINQTCTKTKQPFNLAKIQALDLIYLKNYVINNKLENYEFSLKNFWLNNLCTEKTQTQFFSDLVRVHKKYNIVKALSAKGIFPSETRQYTHDEFKNALQGILGGIRPVIEQIAITIRNKGNVYFQFIEISILLDEKSNAISNPNGEDNNEINYFPLDK